ncbi:hypothetical protein [Devosia riboflavina]
MKLKQFEATIDASQLKQALTEHSFDMVLHGHKHTNHVGIDGSLIPVDSNERFSPLCIVSGGTIAGYPRLNDTQSFKIIKLAGTSGPRTRAEVVEVPLKAAANPRAAIKANSRIFHLPLSSRLPSLHDVAPVKLNLDRDLLKRLAPELEAHAGTLSTHVSLPSHNEEAFAPSLRYRCHSLLETGGTKYFYEVVQATSRIGFGVVSRVHWLVTDVTAMTKSGSDVRVILLIGNLEKTHFSEIVEENEVLISIENLRRDFLPAINSGFLEVRTHLYSQEDAAQLNVGVMS